MSSQLIYFIYLLVLNVLLNKMTCNTLQPPPGYYSWSYGNREALFCPDHCQADPEPDRCCSCKAKPCWEITKNKCPIDTVHLEYLDIFGTSNIIGQINNTFSEFIHTHGMLTAIPGNICNWKHQLVTLDLTYNRLTDISGLKCLTKLDTLRLDYNMIKHVDNTTFSDMKDLRVLSVSHNLLLHLGPNVIKIEHGNILQVDFSGNTYMDSLDISNVLRPGPFCTLNYSHSSVEHLTNELGSVLERVLHGPGEVFLEHTHLGSFINFTSLGIDDMKEFGKYIGGQFHINAISIDCDCVLYPFLESVGPDVGRYWPNVEGQTFECHSPERMKGKNLTEMIENQDFGDLTCDMSETPDCPHYLCGCIDAPAYNKVVVNCTAVGFVSMPDRLPIGAWHNYMVDLIVADNNITELPQRDYYYRLVNLDLRNNPINSFTREAAKEMRAHSIWNIENQTLAMLPPDLINKDPRYITFGLHPVNCNCSNTWIGEWIRLKNGHGRLSCLVDGHIFPAENVTSEFLHCTITAMPSAVIISFAVGAMSAFVLVVIIFYCFQYEIKIYKRLLSKGKLMPDIDTIDVFLSFYDNNEDVFRLAHSYLRQGLIEAGYTVFIPWLDIPCGARHFDELAFGINKAANYVVIMCEDYLDDCQTMSEFEMIWNAFVSDSTKTIIVIDYDNIRASPIRDRRMKALSRTVCLDFRTRKSPLITRLMNKLGHPSTKKKRPNNTNWNSGTDADIDCEEYQNHSDDDINGSAIDLYEMNTFEERTLVQNTESISVFERLSQPKAATCNCRYRKCYLHSEPFGHSKV